MKKLMIGLMVALMLVLSSCEFGDLTGGWNTNNDGDDNLTLVELVEAELLAETDVDAAIEEEIEIEIPESFAKAAPGPNGNGRGRRKVRLMVKQSVDSVDVVKDYQYNATEDTALVTLTKTVYGSIMINQNDTVIVDTPEVWEKDYVYNATSYMQFAQVVCADSCDNDSTATDSVRWKLVAKSIQVGETEGILNTIESVTLEGDDDSTMLVYDDAEALYEVVRGNRADWGSFRERPGRTTTEAYVVIDGDDDVNVLGSTGRYFKLLDDGEGLDLTADDNIYSGEVVKGRGQSRVRIRMIATAAFLDKDAPVEMAAWVLPVK